MQTLSIHHVKSVTITPLQEYKTSKWKKIIVMFEHNSSSHEEEPFEIVLFSEEDDIPVFDSRSTTN